MVAADMVNDRNKAVLLTTDRKLRFLFLFHPRMKVCWEIVLSDAYSAFTNIWVSYPNTSTLKAIWATLCDEGGSFFRFSTPRKSGKDMVLSFLLVFHPTEFTVATPPGGLLRN